ncbi:hypothetical protein VOLCADRAFT_92882 [Volvox carteri f. nagariensis]|uniref:Uncharacterized protein n=1 Tax=Volvox carteri f. nagariensis TaxID=3068 RepID=D8U0Q3_VOLCA|nr:uncharacterized protein VOLCADRAFT_92882 [Volvox carteri f. nagariensis]EFJ46757.1 hypothetical protein VOLCADRAFT_92882 [Volvox carteri f. nagariensis]|eukprot:XP_002952286.1 hypothetical protein VOLCADRAFT_92882 [Volvox carteri f. nagariensis]
MAWFQSHTDGRSRAYCCFQPTRYGGSSDVQPHDMQAVGNTTIPETLGSVQPEGLDHGFATTPGNGNGNSQASGQGAATAAGSGNEKPDGLEHGARGVSCEDPAVQCLSANPDVKHPDVRPRGDDPRPRAWGRPNNRSETEFDDRKSPRKVAFLGRSANVRIYPNYSDPGVYLQLRFGKVQEMDRYGHPVPHHSVPSLADSQDVLFTAGNLTVNGVNMSYVNFSLNPLIFEEFSTSCNTSSDGGNGDAEGGSSETVPRHLLHGGQLRSDAPPATQPQRHYLLPAPIYGGGVDGGNGTRDPQLNVSLLFGLDDALTVPYGETNITIPRNGLKWTVSYRDWPFCNDSNTLSVSLYLLVANNATAQVALDGANNGTRRLKVALGSSYNSSLSFLDYALDGEQEANSSAAGRTTAGVKKMPVNVSLTQDDGAVAVVMDLPNPAPYNSSSFVLYDPTQTTTSAYLAADDPGNVDYVTEVFAVQEYGNVTNGTGNNQASAAGVVRATLWTVVSALLLSLFMAPTPMP